MLRAACQPQWRRTFKLCTCVRAGCAPQNQPEVKDLVKYLHAARSVACRAQQPAACRKAGRGCAAAVTHQKMFSFRFDVSVGWWSRSCWNLQSGSTQDH